MSRWAAWRLSTVGDKAKAVLRKLREMEAEGQPPRRKSEQPEPQQPDPVQTAQASH
jgi:hypothetical protein